MAGLVVKCGWTWPIGCYWSPLGPLLGVSHSAAHRVIDTIGPLLALAPMRTRRVDSVTARWCRPMITAWRHSRNADRDR